MIRNLLVTSTCVILACSISARADVVTDWNLTTRQTINAVPATANPGISTRAIGMMNAAIYDTFQAFQRTHKPFLVNDLTPTAGANLQAAVAKAARDILANCYPEPAAVATWGPEYTNRLNAIVDSQANKDAGVALGQAIAQRYTDKHATDGWNVDAPYTPVDQPGHWTSDPFWNGTQTGWGPGWGNVKPWTMTPKAPGQNYSDHFAAALVDIGGLDLNSAAYTNAFNQVKDYGKLVSPSRTAVQTAIGKFWGYDVPSFGPPPVLFLKNLEDIAAQTNNTERGNARLFAMASVAMADAAIAAWDVKFETDFWRPVTAIQKAGVGGAGDADGNPNTVGDPTWQPLGAPGHGIVTPDFTPPFPAYTSGHATMGGALFKALELFYGTNVYDAIDGVLGNDLEYSLSSDEPGAGGTRNFRRFTELNLADLTTNLNSVDSPEGENGISRIFLGIHWIFDATDGIRLGNAIASDVNANFFFAVPEPGSCVLAVVGGILSLVGFRRRS